MSAKRKSSTACTEAQCGEVSDSSKHNTWPVYVFAAFKHNLSRPEVYDIIQLCCLVVWAASMCWFVQCRLPTQSCLVTVISLQMSPLPHLSTVWYVGGKDKTGCRWHFMNILLIANWTLKSGLSRPKVSHSLSLKRCNFLVCFLGCIWARAMYSGSKL